MTAAEYTPDVHYVRSDGVECCVHATPVGPGSCDACWDLARWDYPSVTPKEAS